MIPLMTLAEMRKSARTNLQSAIVQLYEQNSPILGAMPFESISGPGYLYNREVALAGIAFRGIGEAYTRSHAVINPVFEPLKIMGGDFIYDTFLIATGGEARRGQDVASKIEASARRFDQTFIKGDSSVDPRIFDGLQRRLIGLNLIAGGADAGGTPPSLLKLDELIARVLRPTHLIMNRTLQLGITAAARDSDVGGNVTQTKGDFGEQINSYNGLPILVLEEDDLGAQILDFNEAATSGGATASSIYCVSLQAGRLWGIQSGPIRARDLGEVHSNPGKLTRVEWFMGMVLAQYRAAARLWSISNAPWTK